MPGFFAACDRKEKCAVKCGWFMPSLEVRPCGSSRVHSLGLRAMSGVLLAFFLLPLFIPFFSFGSESTLPACCRRDGKHQCAMSARLRESVQSGSSEPVVRDVTSPCPYRSRLLMAFISRVLLVPCAPVFSGQAFSYTAPGLESILLARLSAIRGNPKRGPPALPA